MGERGPHDRFQWDDDGDSLDEIVLSGVTFHMERMGHHAWWIGISDGRGNDLAINFSADREPRMDPETPWAGVRREVRGPLLYHLPPWTDRNEREHRCELHKSHKRCRCECGATRKNPEAAA